MENLLTQLKELQNECEEKHIHYSLFVSNRGEGLSGTANLTLKEISILVENIARSLPADQIRFLQHILSLVAQEKQLDTLGMRN